jgi:hypothetical protein
MRRWTALGFGHVVFTVLAVFALLLPAAAADDGKGPFAEFYSYLPAKPDIKLPEISIPFWTISRRRSAPTGTAITTAP